MVAEARYSGDIAIEKERAEGDARVIGTYAQAYHNYGSSLGWICSTVAGATCNTASVANYGFDALHYFIYSRLGRDHRAQKSKEMIGFEGDSTYLEV